MLQEKYPTWEDLENMEIVDYGNTGTTALWDGENYFNQSGDWLRDPNEYDRNAEGYTPFGDE